MSGLSEKLFYINLPPTVASEDAEHQVQQFTTSAAAQSFDWVGPLGSAAPKGKCFIELESLTSDCYVRFGSAVTTGTTTANGMHLSASYDRGMKKLYVDPVKHRYIDCIAAGAGKLNVRVCSPIGERRDI